MSEAVVIQLIVTAGALVAIILGKVKLDRIGRDARVSREQTANEHADAEYPNLRDELTAMRGEVSAGLGRLEAGQKRHDSEIGGIRHAQRQQTDALARLDERMEGRDAEQRREHAVLAKRLDDHLTPTT
ncbi:hypothetical protein ACFWGN_20935 [Oerskovia sp. NPDC060338]|uniref:hypothetical protein n=1 Tax=Oerskovia sp. NPDC060338 TaxID=3347100 RepID=UPI00365FB952